MRHSRHTTSMAETPDGLRFRLDFKLQRSRFQITNDSCRTMTPHIPISITE
jgi:hypothetical protein